MCLNKKAISIYANEYIHGTVRDVGIVYLYTLMCLPWKALDMM